MRYLCLIFRDLFVISFILLIILLIAEDLRSNFVSVWLDLRHIFYLTVSSGLITLFTSQFKEKVLK